MTARRAGRLRLLGGYEPVDFYCEAEGQFKEAVSFRLEFMA